MSETKLVYVVLRRSGKPMTFKSGLSMYPDASTEMDYLSLLSALSWYSISYGAHTGLA